MSSQIKTTDMHSQRLYTSGSALSSKQGETAELFMNYASILIDLIKEVTLPLKTSHVALCDKKCLVNVTLHNNVLSPCSISITSLLMNGPASQAPKLKTNCQKMRRCHSMQLSLIMPYVEIFESCDTRLV